MSSGGLQFGILEIVASFGNVWADQSYWQVITSLSICSDCFRITPAQRQRPGHVNLLVVGLQMEMWEELKP